MIAYLSAPRRFFLQGPASTYILEVDRYGHLQHVHWGGRIRPGDLPEVASVIWRSQTVRAESGGEPYSLDFQPQECPAGGLSDFRNPAVLVEHPDGTSVLDLVYESHVIQPGKPALSGLPATYVEDPAEADTLVVTLCDRVSGVRIELSYTQFRDHDAVARNLRVVNAGDATRHVMRALSASVDLPPGQRSLLTLNGSPLRERHMSVTSLQPGVQGVLSRRGTSSHQHNPFIALLDAGSDEDHGEVRGLMLAYSGCFTAQVEVDHYGWQRMQIGLDAPGFRWGLAPGETFQAPEALLLWSGDGLGGLSRTSHRLLRTRMVRGRHRDTPFPILINNWEATYFNFDADKLTAIAATAKAVGVETLGMDDGWFGARDSDRAGLGDWVCNERKLPGGLPAIAARMEALGMGFGLWLEPEMVNPDSDLYRAHPDWCLQIPGRVPKLGRNQLVLDLSRPEVVEHVYQAVAALLGSARISYVKWDMNRYLSDVASPAHPPGEVHHRFILGVYRLLDRVTRDFPDTRIEGCAAGGGRFDAGMLQYMPQHWTSDNTDAIARLSIQHGTSIGYPLSSMVAHVSACPNHQVHRNTPMRTRGHVAFTGAFGFELDLAKLSEQDLATVRELVEEYRRVRELLAAGDLYRLIDPTGGRAAAWMVVSPDRSRALVTFVSILVEANAPLPVLRLRGLDPAADYRVDQDVLGGDALMRIGLRPHIGTDFTSRTWHIERI
jgi:alpha-galactosidase